MCFVVCHAHRWRDADDAAGKWSEQMDTVAAVAQIAPPNNGDGDIAGRCVSDGGAFDAEHGSFAANFTDSAGLFEVSQSVDQNF